jgi:hypothetical protein
MKWDDLENNLRDLISGYSDEFYDNLGSAMSIYGKQISHDTDIVERRMFFDWYIHDYIIPDKDDTIIRLFLKQYGKKLQDIERDAVISWSNSFLRFLEVLEIKIGTGYKASDVFSKEEFFIHDMSSSAAVKKYDILYVRLYPVGNIIRFAGGVISLPYRFLPYIKEYVLHNIMKLDKTSDRGTKSDFSPYLETCLKSQSLSIIHYLDSLSDNTRTVTTFEGDIAVLSETVFIIKNSRRIMAALNSSRHFARLENDGKFVRFDWIEKLEGDSVQNLLESENGKLDNKQQGNDGLTDYEGVKLNTLLWLPTIGEHDSKISKDNKKYTLYRVLGNLSIKGKLLIIQCMSDKLLGRCNDIIQNLGGKYLDHRVDKYSELQGAIKGNTGEDDLEYKNSGVNDIADETFEEEIPDSVKQQANDYFEKYYENWIDIKIPALHNMTPLEIAKTEEGRVMLEELLRELENERARSTIEDLAVFPVEKIRQRLGL